MEDGRSLDEVEVRNLISLRKRIIYPIRKFFFIYILWLISIHPVPCFEYEYSQMLFLVILRKTTCSRSSYDWELSSTCVYYALSSKTMSIYSTFICKCSASLSFNCMAYYSKSILLVWLHLFYFLLIYWIAANQSNESKI
jgi:hypothetical protein